jgi:multiple sugar transport system ATP-binding protein
VILGIRPEDMEDAALVGEVDPSRCVSAVVDIREDMGSEIFVHFAVAAPAVRGEDVKAAMGEEALEATAEHVRQGTLFVARVDRESRAREGDTMRLAVTTSRLHVFDIASGEAIYDAVAGGRAARDASAPLAEPAEQSG